jgi:uncharacterized phage-associated protein
MGKLYDDKLKQLILYILAHPEYKEGGIKKLNKLLYFIDFYFYRDHEKQISGAKYAKASMGPVLDDYQHIFKQLVADGIVSLSEDEGKMLYKPLQSCDIHQFTGEEIDHIGHVISRYGKLGSAELEAISHQQQPWLLTENFGDIIDPDLALLIGNFEADQEGVVMDNQQLKKELVHLANSVE